MSSLQKALVQEKKSSLQKALVQEMDGGKRNRSRKNPPTVSTAHESSSDDDDSSSDDNSIIEEDRQIESEDAMKIREQAIKLVNTPSSGPHAEAAKRKHGQQTFVSPYQQQKNTQSAPSSPFSSYQSPSQYDMHDPLSHPRAHTAEPLSMTQMVVNCVSDVCKSSSSEIINKVLHSGYKSVNNYENPPVNGKWGDIDTSQHGYGNGNKPPSKSNMPARYQDWLATPFESVRYVDLSWSSIKSMEDRDDDRDLFPSANKSCYRLVRSVIFGYNEIGFRGEFPQHNMYIDNKKRINWTVVLNKAQTDYKRMMF